MKKLKIISTLGLLCTPMFLSCSDDSNDGGASSNSTSMLDYCVFEAEEMCLPGPANSCPKGGTLNDFCPPSFLNMGSKIDGNSSSSYSSSEGGAGSSSSSGYEVVGVFGPAIFIDPRDGKEYGYAIFGGKVWMTENLSYSRSNTLGSCDNCDNGHGRIYSYSVAIDGKEPQGLCPKGWHIPSPAEWRAQFLGLEGSYWANSENNYFTCVLGDCIQKTASPDDSFPVRCVADELISCGTGMYNPVYQFCSSNKIHEKCNSNLYNPANEFCYGASILEKCEGEDYNPTEEDCLMGFKFPKCGGNLYNEETHFCSGGTLLRKCGGEIYTPANEGCFEDIVFPKCGGNLYNPAIQECRSGTIVNTTAPIAEIK